MLDIVQLHRLRKYIHNNQKYTDLYKYEVDLPKEHYDTVYRKVKIDHVVKQKLQKTLSMARLFYTGGIYYQNDYKIINSSSIEFQVIDLRNNSTYYNNVWNEFCENAYPTIWITSKLLQLDMVDDKYKQNFGARHEIYEIDYIYVIDLFEAINAITKSKTEKIQIMYQLCNYCKGKEE